MSSNRQFWSNSGNRYWTPARKKGDIGQVINNAKTYIGLEGNKVINPFAALHHKRVQYRGKVGGNHWFKLLEDSGDFKTGFVFIWQLKWIMWE